MNKSRIRNFTGRERLFFKIFLLIALIALTAAGCTRFFLRYGELSSRINAQKELIRKASSNADTVPPGELRQRREALADRLEAVSAGTSLDEYSFGTSVLELLQDHSIEIRSYRPAPRRGTEEKPGFSCTGSAEPADLISFFSEINREYPWWHCIGLNITGGSKAGLLDFTFELVQGAGSGEQKE